MSSAHIACLPIAGLRLQLGQVLLADLSEFELLFFGHYVSSEFHHQYRFAMSNLDYLFFALSVVAGAGLGGSGTFWKEGTGAPP